jgi:hypothetical protein
MKEHKVYELVDQEGRIVDVGYTGGPLKNRFYDHTKRKPTQSGRGKFYGRTDLTIRVHSTYLSNKEALIAEGSRKIELGIPWTEKQNQINNGYRFMKVAQVHAQKRITCEFCGTESNKLNYGRWHGDRCKLKTTNR